MAPVTFRLVALSDTSASTSFVDAIRSLATGETPLYVGRCEHWVHAPVVSSKVLTGTGHLMERWDYLVVTKHPDETSPLPSSITSYVEKEWSITAHVDDEQLNSLAAANRKRSSAAVPPLPKGWSPDDHSGLDEAVVPEDLEASLGLSSFPLGSRKDSPDQALPIKDFIRSFGAQHTGPIAMFNLLAYMPDGRPQYMKYIAAFVEWLGVRYGADPVFAGLGVLDWSSKADEKVEADEGWKDTALVWYPSIWHFAKLLDDPDYAKVDREYKAGAIRDNPLMCCVEVNLE